MESIWNKTDVFTAYGCTSAKQFECRIGSERLALIGWGKGKQFFTPKEIRKIFEVLGEPLQKAELRG
ncbi:hypothetical protein [Runella sp. SP2]|uniref:hypothetical protein n=1 Tax=Runella sp. SP2 TaxID=2268026 RepID=UPI000F08F13B|nr:hypothetical protein [Runella sp. SP2]AYQ31966.1 hypothetical protein DTQ70_07175 [Runella sp. SP2]